MSALTCMVVCGVPVGVGELSAAGIARASMFFLGLHKKQRPGMLQLARERGKAKKKRSARAPRVPPGGIFWLKAQGAPRGSRGVRPVLPLPCRSFAPGRSCALGLSHSLTWQSAESIPNTRGQALAVRGKSGGKVHVISHAAAKSSPGVLSPGSLSCIFRAASAHV